MRISNLLHVAYRSFLSANACQVSVMYVDHIDEDSYNWCLFLLENYCVVMTLFGDHRSSLHRNAAIRKIIISRKRFEQILS